MDFTESDLDFFAEVVEEIDDVWLQARVADVLWTVRRKLGTRMALIAVDAYRAIPLDHDTWIHDGGNCWKRALRLGAMLRTDAGDRLVEMEGAILASFKRAGLDEGFLALWMAELLFENGLGKSEAEGIADRLAACANELELMKDIYKARAYFGHALRWYRALGKNAQTTEMAVRLAENWVKSAEERLESKDPSHLVAAGFYEKAIQIYRTIPHASRPMHKVNERMEELRIRMTESGERSLGEMGHFSTDPVDISKIVMQACAGVSGKDFLEALAAFVNHTRGVEVEKLKAEATKAMARFPLQAMLSSTHVSGDGRVIARSNGSSPGEESLAEPGTALWDQMLKHYMLGIALKVQGEILPALEVLNLEHRLLLEDFVRIAQHSPIVPPGRETLWGVGLRSGFEGDFGTAVHLISPQIEGMVRFHLKNAGVKTTNLDRDGIENEIGLSNLMELAEVESIFGKDLAFEFKALFCDATGPNLRNEVAHGLLDDSIFRSTAAVYAWWLALKLAFNPFWNLARKARASTEEPSEADIKSRDRREPN